MSTATAVDEEEVPVLRLFACVGCGVVASVGAFAATFNLIVALGVYIFVACAAYAFSWVLLG